MQGYLHEELAPHFFFDSKLIILSAAALWCWSVSRYIQLVVGQAINACNMPKQVTSLKVEHGPSI